MISGGWGGLISGEGIIATNCYSHHCSPFFWAQRVLQGHAGTFYFRSLKPAQLCRVPDANTVRALLLEATSSHAALLERLDLVTCGTRGTSKRDTSAYSCLRESGGVDLSTSKSMLYTAATLGFVGFTEGTPRPLTLQGWHATRTDFEGNRQHSTMLPHNPSNPKPCKP